MYVQKETNAVCLLLLLLLHVLSVSANSKYIKPVQQVGNDEMPVFRKIKQRARSCLFCDVHNVTPRLLLRAYCFSRATFIIKCSVFQFPLRRNMFSLNYKCTFIAETSIS